MIVVDFIAREMIGKLIRGAATAEKRAKIVSRFVIRRAKEVNGRLDCLESTASFHMRRLLSVGRSLQMISKLLGLLDKRAVKFDATLEEYRESCAKMWDDLRKGEHKIKSIEGDMNDNSTDCDAMWRHIRALERQEKALGYFRGQSVLNGAESRKLQDKVDALCKSNIQLKDKVDALEKLHSTKIAGFEYSTGPPPSIEECQQAMEAADDKVELGN